jgi:hypothetical protein
LTPPDYVLWGYVKDKVFATPVPNVQELKKRIMDAVNSVTPGMLRNVWREMKYRLDVCRVTNGGHVKVH